METQEKLRESEARFKAIFDHMSSGVVVFKPVGDGEDFVILNLNRAFRRIEKIHESEVVGNKTLFEILPFYKESDLLERFRRVWQTGNPESGAVTFQAGPRNRRLAGILHLPPALHGDRGDLRRCDGKERLGRGSRRLCRSSSSCPRRWNPSEPSQAALPTISGISCRPFQATPSTWNWFAAKSRIVADLTTNIYDSVEKGVDLINNLLHFSRRGGEYQKVALDLSEVIKQTHEIIAKVLNRNIEIVLNLDKDLFIKGNRSLLSQVFMNLYSNANDAMPNGGKLTVEAKRKGNKVLAVVSDTGIGMDEKTIEKVFDPFFTLKEVGKGTGLGLSTVHGIVEEHKGEHLRVVQAG